MNPLTRQAPLRLAILRITLAAACMAALAACSSGEGGPAFGSSSQTDPGTVDFAIAYVKRTLPTPPDTLQDDARELRTFNVDADVFVRDRASPSAPERSVTQRITGNTEEWDVKDLESAFDGEKLIFAMRGPMIPNADEEDQPTWNIWEYTLDTDTLRRVIVSDIIAEAGHDVAPHYLPDGRIVFSSTRQRQSQAILLDESKPQFPALDENRNEPGFVLHVMNADGTDIHQISFNQSHDLDPTVLNNGRVLFSRWDHAQSNNNSNDGISLFTVNPDGSDLQLHYGFNSHDTGTNDSIVQFLQPRQLENGRILALLRPFVGTNLGSDIISIDAANYVENTQPTLPNRGVLSGPAQERAVTNDVRLLPTEPSPGGMFSAAYPLHDGSNRMFVSWSLCRIMENGIIVPCTDARLANPNSQPAPPSFGIWIYDFSTDNQLPVVPPEEGVMFTDMVAMKPRTLPPVILDKVPGVDINQTLFNENAGVLHIRSVYDIDGADTAPGGIAAISNPDNPGYATRPARFLRIEKAVSIPDEDVRDFRNTAFGASNFMREILGYAPVEPDGSVRVKVPANVAFAISVVGADGRRLPGIIGSRHNSWLQLRPGEVRECSGCHNPDSGESHGRDNLFAAVNAGAAVNGAFPGTNSALGLVDVGDTMAEARNRIMCGAAGCPPTMDVIGVDIWPSVQPAAFDYCYSTGGTEVGNDPSLPGDALARHACATSLQTAPPTTPTCERQWSSGCRITINYETHIHPLWGITRTVDANNDNTPDTDGMGNIINRQCTGCHTNAVANVAQVPAAHLDLSDGASDQQADHFKSYRELLFTDRRQTLNMAGTLEDECAQTDPNTGLCVSFFILTPPMTAGSAQASGRFFNCFDSGAGCPTVDHRTFLSAAEKRLIAEWLDIGAQYYNNPFEAPLN